MDTQAEEHKTKRQKKNKQVAQPVAEDKKPSSAPVSVAKPAPKPKKELIPITRDNCSEYVSRYADLRGQVASPETKAMVSECNLIRQSLLRFYTDAGIESEENEVVLPGEDGEDGEDDQREFVVEFGYNKRKQKPRKEPTLMDIKQFLRVALAHSLSLPAESVPPFEKVFEDVLRFKQADDMANGVDAKEFKLVPFIKVAMKAEKSEFITC